MAAGCNEIITSVYFASIGSSNVWVAIFIDETKMVLELEAICKIREPYILPNTSEVIPGGIQMTTSTATLSAYTGQ